MKLPSWRERPNRPDLEAQHRSLQKNNVVARLLANRGIGTGEVGLFFNPKLDFINWRSALGGIRQAAELFLEVRRRNGKIAVIGDYDVDGTASAAMLQLLCRQLGIHCHVFLPSRHEHGYGLNARTVPAFIQSVGTPPDLLIAADCGTSSDPEIEQLRKFGAHRIAIIDHHIADPKRFSKSADIVVNWRLGDDDEMCAAGQIFVMAKVIEAILDKKLTTELLPLAAIATVADMSPVRGLNRVIVKNGLARAPKTNLPGLRYLLQTCDVDENGISQTDVAFNIAPRINAIGRMEKSNPAYELLVEENDAQAAILAEQLEECNHDRKVLQNEIVEAATEQADRLQKNGVGQHGLMLVDSQWNIGIVGVVASRIVERFFVPTLVMGGFEGHIKGSGRSMEGVHLKNIMDSCADKLFTAYGGHEMAAGATLKDEAVTRAAEIWDSACAEYFKHNPRPDPVLFYDAELPPEYVTADNCRHLRETFHPYDRSENPEPVFRMSGLDVSGVITKSGATHSLIRFSGRKGGWRLPLQFKSFRPEHQVVLDGQTIDILYTMSQSWNERFGPCLWVKDVRVIDEMEWDAAPSPSVK